MIASLSASQNVKYCGYSVTCARPCHAYTTARRRLYIVTLRYSSFSFSVVYWFHYLLTCILYMSECNSLLNCYHEFHRCRVHVYSLRHAKDPVMGTIMVTKHVTCHSEDVCQLYVYICTDLLGHKNIVRYIDWSRVPLHRRVHTHSLWIWFVWAVVESVDSGDQLSSDILHRLDSTDWHICHE